MGFGSNPFVNGIDNLAIISAYGKLMCDMNNSFAEVLETYKSDVKVNETPPEEVAKSFHDIFLNTMLRSAKIVATNQKD